MTAAEAAIGKAVGEAVDCALCDLAYADTEMAG